MLEVIPLYCQRITPVCGLYLGQAQIRVTLVFIHCSLSKLDCLQVWPGVLQAFMDLPLFLYSSKYRLFLNIVTNYPSNQKVWLQLNRATVVTKHFKLEILPFISIVCPIVSGTPSSIIISLLSCCIPGNIGTVNNTLAQLHIAINT